MPHTAATPEQTDTAHAMACMEIWGGNRAIDSGISSPGIDAWIVSRPHAGAENGGDIHYVSMCASGRIARFAVADVAGHGEAVADLAVGLRNLMRKGINTLDQSRFARRLNEAFLAESRLGVFATAVLATYFAPTDHLIVCNAGHPPPLLYRAALDVWAALTPDTEPDGSPAPRGLPLGVIDPTDYTQQAVRLEPGDLVILYTDSLIEQKSADGPMLGVDGLVGLCAGLDESKPEDLAHALTRRVTEYGGGRDPDDDLTVLVLHHNAGDPPRRSIGDRVSAYARMLGLGSV